MSISIEASERSKAYSMLLCDDTQSYYVMSDEKAVDIKNKRVEKSNMSLRHLINKQAIVSTKVQGSTYNKRTFPFEMSDAKHVRALDIICEMFCNPWESSETKRKDLTNDIADLFIAIDEKRLVIITSDEYNDLVSNQKAKRKSRAKAK